MTTTRFRRTPLVLSLSLACLLAVGSTASADMVDFSGLPLKGVSILDIEDGRIIYVDQGGRERSETVARLKAIGIEGLTDLDKAEQLFKDGNYKAAGTAFMAAKGKARQKWAKTWIDARLVTTYDKAGQPLQAIRAYLSLFNNNVHEAFLVNSPSQASILHLTKAEDHQAAVKEVDTAIKSARRTVPDALKSLQVLLRDHNPEQAAQTLAAAKASGQDTTNLVILPKSEITMPRKMIIGTTDPVTRHLMKGEFKQALTTVDERLNSGEAGRLYERLYQRGLAQLNLGKQTNDQGMIKSAGLSFMRVVIYNSRGVYAGPAYIEAGHVHDLLGKPQLAKQLYDQAINYIDEETEPELYKRLDLFKTGGKGAANDSANEATTPAGE